MKKNKLDQQKQYVDVQSHEDRNILPTDRDMSQNKEISKKKTLSDRDLKNLEYQHKIRYATYGTRILSKDAGYAERAKYRLIKLYYKILDVLKVSPTYLQNESELPEIDTIPYLYLKEHCNCNDYFLKIMDLDNLQNLAILNKDPLEMYISQCELYTGMYNDGERTNPNDETMSICKFLKDYLEDKRAHVSILQQMVNFYDHHNDLPINKKIRIQLNGILNLIQSEMSEFDPYMYNGHIMYNLYIYHILKDRGILTSFFNQFLLNPYGMQRIIEDYQRLMRAYTNNYLELDRIQHPNPNFELSDWVIDNPKDFSIKYYKNIDKNSQPMFEFHHPKYKKIIKQDKFIVKRLRELIEGIDKQNKGELSIPYWYGTSTLSKTDLKLASQVDALDTTIKDKKRKGPMKNQYNVTDFNAFIKSIVKEFKGTPLEWKHNKGSKSSLKSNITIEVIY